jgi:FkbM family methyltransferase
MKLSKRNQILNRRIENIKKTVLSELEPEAGDNESVLLWKKVYADYLNAYARYTGKLKIIPAGLLKKLGVTKPELLDGLPGVKIGYVQCGNVKLPVPESAVDRLYFSGFILDSFTQYLLGMNPADGDRRVYDFMPEGPYERGRVCVEKGAVVVDAGANMGEFSLLAAEKGAIVHAFEPSARIREKYLLPCLAMNEALADFVTIAPFALSDGEGTAYFAAAEDNPGAGRLTGGGESGEAVTGMAGPGVIRGERATMAPNKNMEKVDLISLDEYVHRQNLQAVDFIKADIEGAERLMLRGARGVLRDFAPRLAICTYHLPDDPELLEALILEANPHYTLEHRYLKLYAYVKER